ncbi:MAG: FadR/GntR family transcriptional regulator [Bacilli bacterium]
MFEPISDNIALSEKIIFQITDAIVKGELKPGGRLPTERELAEEFKVSRTAIRDAIKVLYGRGLVDVKHGVGIFIADQSNKLYDTAAAIVSAPSGLGELFEVRKVLESQAACWAAQRADASHLNRLRGIVAQAKEGASDLEFLSEKDGQFHVAVAEASNNLVLVRIMWTILGLLTSAREASLQIPGRPLESLSQHERIIQAITDRDADAAREAMLTHLDSVESSVALNMQGPVHN